MRGERQRQQQARPSSPKTDFYHRTPLIPLPGPSPRSRGEGGCHDVQHAPRHASRQPWPLTFKGRVRVFAKPVHGVLLKAHDHIRRLPLTQRIRPFLFRSSWNSVMSRSSVE